MSKEKKIESGKEDEKAESPQETEAESIDNIALQKTDEQLKTANSKLTTDNSSLIAENSKLQTKTMEVHHPHHVTHKKKWGEYVLEFFMLFLAVFLGFLAEYYLEHKIEADRVEKYMHDMVENLKYDTTRVAVNLPSNQETKKDLDSFRYKIKDAIAGQANTNLLYYYSLKINEYSEVAFNKSTITQLKNSGQLRLMKNDSLINEILDYYERKVYASEIYNGEAKSAFQEFTKEMNNVFSTTPFDFVNSFSDSTYSGQMENDYKKSLLSVLNSQSLQLLSKDKTSLEKLHTVAMRFEIALINYDRFLNYSRSGAKKLIAEIQKEYHLKDE